MTKHIKSIAICVLGMHRSGTSTITRGLNLLGVYLGKEEELMRPLPENPEGFWERYDVYYLLERVLSILKRDWSSTAPLPQNWHKSPEICPLKEELINLVNDKFSGQTIWAWKDPRTCLLLPIWRDVLTELGIELKVLFVVRNPLDVARSLERRNNFTLDKGLAIWFNNTIVALKEVVGLETIILSYDCFLDDWETELKRCAVNLGIVWPADEAGFREKMAQFVRCDLRHSVSGLEELKAVNPPAPVIDLYSLVLDILTGKTTLDVAERTIKVMYQEFLGYSRFFEFDLSELADYRLRLEKATYSPEFLPAIIELKKELDSRTQWAWNLDADLRATREQIMALQTSKSWKITKPLRLLGDFLQRGQKGR